VGLLLKGLELYWHSSFGSKFHKAGAELKDDLGEILTEGLRMTENNDNGRLNDGGT
jgi:hypothetical protein